MSEALIPLKLGIVTQPPALTLKYRGTAGKERQRVMPIRFLNKFGTVENVIKELKTRHGQHLEKVPDIRIEKMLRIIQEVQKGRSLDEAIAIISQDFELDPNQDLNKLTDEDLAKKKKIMDSSFEKNQLKPGDEGYVYDKQVDFNTDNKGEAGWDSTGEQDDAQDDDFWS
ncbi:Centrosomal protein of 19 kDa [Halocaridina rubra]|uniref:Centrosomal protein of 19 kDa n=1 Tax=Halocaridina rubra TaxID=373956 RepID=A0AAN8WIJ4_HALRR